MSRYNKNALRKLEAIFQQLEYKVRYEKGNFKSGYCLVEERKIVVINRFFDVDGRARTMIEILSGMNLEQVALEEGLAKFLGEVISAHALAASS
jgi:hypothetical protein